MQVMQEPSWETRFWDVATARPVGPVLKESVAQTAGVYADAD